MILIKISAYLRHEVGKNISNDIFHKKETLTLNSSYVIMGYYRTGIQFFLVEKNFYTQNFHNVGKSFTFLSLYIGFSSIETDNFGRFV